MSIAITTGSLALGALLVDRLAFSLRDTLSTFYGVESDAIDSTATVAGSLGVGEATAATIALLTSIAFIATERRRIRRLRAAAADIARANRLRTVERLGLADRLEMLVGRASVYSAVLMGAYVFDASFERYLSGLGFGLDITEWRSVLPLASIYGLCVIAGLLTAGISLFGLRVLTSLQQLGGVLLRRAHRRVVVLPRPDLSTPTLGFAEMLGTTLLSRPPPVGAPA
jgi:hypothetical protein